MGADAAVVVVVAVAAAEVASVVEAAVCLGLRSADLHRWAAAERDRRLAPVPASAAPQPAHGPAPAQSRVPEQEQAHDPAPAPLRVPEQEQAPGPALAPSPVRALAPAVVPQPEI